MAILDSNFHPKNFVASLALLHTPEANMKPKFLKSVKRRAKQSPKTIGRSVASVDLSGLIWPQEISFDLKRLPLTSREFKGPQGISWYLTILPPLQMFYHIFLPCFAKFSLLFVISCPFFWPNTCSPVSFVLLDLLLLCLLYLERSLISNVMYFSSILLLIWLKNTVRWWKGLHFYPTKNERNTAAHIFGRHAAAASNRITKKKHHFDAFFSSSICSFMRKRTHT